MRSLASIVAVVAASTGWLLPAAAQPDKPWHVEGKLLGKDQKKSKDISGIACLSAGLPRTCLVIDDEAQFAQVVIVQDGALLAGDTIRLVDPDKQQMEHRRRGHRLRRRHIVQARRLLHRGLARPSARPRGQARCDGGRRRDQGAL